MSNGILRVELRGRTEDLATSTQRLGLKNVAIALTADEMLGKTLSQLGNNTIRRKHTWVHFIRNDRFSLQYYEFFSMRVAS